MVIPEERDGKSDAAVQLDRDPAKPSDATSTRKAGGRESQEEEHRKVHIASRYLHVMQFKTKTKYKHFVKLKIYKI